LRQGIIVHCPIVRAEAELTLGEVTLRGEHLPADLVFAGWLAAALDLRVFVLRDGGRPHFVAQLLDHDRALPPSAAAQTDFVQCFSFFCCSL
jgi:hypothetical protein